MLMCIIILLATNIYLLYFYSTLVVEQNPEYIEDCFSYFYTYIIMCIIRYYYDDV